jgi:nucleoside-diphosphate-sugar epimerase
VSVLLIGISGSSGEAIVERLVSQGDEVRVVEDDPATAQRWRSRGAYVARSSSDLPDLIERAAQNVRTVVVGEGAANDIDAILSGAAAAQVERVIWFGSSASAGAARAVRDFPSQHVVLNTGRRRLLRGGVDDELIAVAIDAADDMGGAPRLVLDLTDPGAWAELGVSNPFS